MITESQLYLRKEGLITAGDVKDISEMYTRLLKTLLINTLHHYTEPAGCQTDESDNQARNSLRLGIDKDLGKPTSIQELNVEKGRRALEPSDTSSNPALAHW